MLLDWIVYAESLKNSVLTLRSPRLEGSPEFRICYDTKTWFSVRH